MRRMRLLESPIRISEHEDRDALVIRIHRLGLPEEVSNRLLEKTLELQEVLRVGDQPRAALLNGYRDREVKNVIKAETHGKCAYCESKIDHVYFGDIEHIKPKSLYPQLRLTYENLTYVCAVCNNHKRDYDSDTDPLVNPCEDEPGEHLIALGTLVLGNPHSQKGIATEQVLDLNRAELVNRRMDRIKSLHNLAQLYAQMDDGRRKEIVRSELEEESSDSKEYSFCVRAYLSNVLEELPDDADVRADAE